MRLFKMIRLFKRNKSIANVTKALNMRSGLAQMISLAAVTTFLTHIVACFWYMIAKFDGFSPDSWVARAGIVYEPAAGVYLRSFYWALQTLTTVGFGDINGRTKTERLYCVLWMLLGICFYSYAIGNMTNLIETMDQSNQALNEKLDVLKEMRNRTDMPNRIF